MNNSEQIICNITNDILSEKGHALYQKWTNHYKDFKGAGLEDWVSMVRDKMLVELVEGVANTSGIVLNTDEIGLVEEIFDQFLLTFHLLQAHKKMAPYDDLGTGMKFF
jgi:hypothetical protein